MVGSTLIDYATNKFNATFSGIISWDAELLTGQKTLSNYVDDMINSIGGSNIGRIFADVKVTETHKMQSTITDQTLEDGSSVHEHVIPQPEQITIQIEETNNTAGSRFVGGFYGPQQTFDKLTELWKKAIPLTITTQHKQYKNMAIVNMPILHRAPYRNALQITIDLKKLEFTNLQTYSYKAKGVIGKAASVMKDGGRQDVKTWTNSLA